MTCSTRPHRGNENQPERAAAAAWVGVCLAAVVVHRMQHSSDHVAMRQGGMLPCLMADSVLLRKMQPLLACDYAQTCGDLRH
jgi:hypothetical protein